MLTCLHGDKYSGGRDLSGNRRTNMEQSFDQRFEKVNEALRVSCKKGYPVRVVRSFKETRSSYAPEKGLRYDGIYRIEECWRKVGIQVNMCNQLYKNFVFGLFFSKEVDCCWKWIKPPPLSRAVGHKRKSDGNNRPMGALKQVKRITVRKKLLKEFSCLICKQVMAQPVTTPCAHNFCKSCLEGAFAGQTFVRKRSNGGRVLRAQKNVMKCPSCKNDISDFLKDPQVNRELMEVIESLKKKTEQNDELAEETNEEETDVSEEFSDPDPVAESSKSSHENHEETGVNGSSQNPTPKCKPKRVNKRKKVNVGDCSVKNGESNEETNVTGGSQNPTMKSTLKRANKRKKVDAGDHLVKNSDRDKNQIATEKPDGLIADPEAGKVEAGDVKVGNKEMQAEEALREGNDSPASPLLMSSDGQDSA